MDNRIPLFEIAWDEHDIANVVESISRGGYWAKGPFVDKFESKLESYFNIEHAITVNSGTEALIAALRGTKIGPGDEVIVPSMTFIATANAVRLTGAEPVFADIEQETYGLDPESVRDRITEDTAGIIPVHLYGGPCNIDELSTIAESRDLFLIEDAAEAFGSTLNDTLVGTFGDAGILSFCQNKIIVTGEGGAVITDNDELAKRIRLYRSHGRVSEEYFDQAESGDYVTLGSNTRMSDITAAIGCAQIDKADVLIDGRRSAANRMNDALSSIDGVRVPVPLDRGEHVYQLYTIQLDESIDRATVIDTLNEHGISSKIYWDTPVHETTYYVNSLKQTPTGLINTATVADTVLSLPMYPDLSTAAIDRISKAVVDGVKRAR